MGREARTPIVKSTRRTVLKAGVGLAAVSGWPFASTSKAAASTAIRLVLSVATGGSLDIMMRVIGQKLTDSWNQQVIIDTKPGANGAIAASTVAKSAPNGLTLLVTNFSLLSSVVLDENPGYQLSELAPVSIMVQLPVAIGVRPALGVGTLKQYVQLAKERPGKLSYGTWGQGSGGNFIGEQLNASAGIDAVHVPYKGEAPAIQDLLAGQIDAVVTGLGTQKRYDGKIISLAITGARRFSLYPDVPTFVELGYPEAGRFLGWNGLFAPADTPKPYVERLAAEIGRILKLPDVSQKMLELAYDPVAMSPTQSAQFMTDQVASIRGIVREGRVKL